MPVLNLLPEAPSDALLSCGTLAGSRRRTATALFPLQPTSLPLRVRSNPFHLWSKTLSRAPTYRSLVVLQKLNANPNGGARSGADDFITRVLEENPSQVEPKFLVGDRFVTLREKQSSGKESNFGVIESGKQLLGQSVTRKEGDEGGGWKEGDRGNPVYLNDLLREFKGKLYVPEEVFRENLSEEAEFKNNLRALPLMSFEDFQKHIKTGKVKLLTSAHDDSSENDYIDFVVDLKETPGGKNMQKTKWAIRLTANQAQVALEEYRGPQYEIEKQTRSYVGKLPEYPHPVASSIASRFIVELGMVTAVIGAVASVIAVVFMVFTASAAFALTSFLYGATIYVVWPLAKPIVNFVLGIISSIAESILEHVIEIFSEGGFFSKIDEFYTFGGVSASLQMLKPIMLVLGTMAVLVRFTLSRRPKNFRKWDLWQGIEFGHSKAQARVDGSTGVLFSDVAGIDEAVEELQELVRYLKNPELFDKMGIKPPHGVLLEGPPGCGKTLIAKAIAGEAGVPFYQMAGSEFVEVLVGVGSARIRDLFMRAKVNKPSVIFIDEIDALATRRQGMYNESTEYFYNAATQERETTLNQLLIELDGFDTGKGVIFLGATNRRDLLDPAILRPGRFDRKIRIRPPGPKGRLEILKVHARKVKMSPTVDLSTYALNLSGWTGAKLAQLVQDSALVAVRNRHESILQSDMDEAFDRLTIGPKRLGVKLSHHGRCRRAVTEVGVALTSHLLRRYENAKVEFCDRISVIPRGRRFSQVVFRHLDEESCVFERRPQLLHRLQVFLGGRAAEEIIFGRDTSKASLKYLRDATCLARKILTIWNLENPMTIHGERIRRPKRRRRYIGPPLDFEGFLYDDCGLTEPPLNFDLDAIVARRTEGLMRDMYKATTSLLKKNIAALVKTVKVLLDNGEISGEQIEFILNNYPADTPVKLVLEEKNPGTLPFFEVADGKRDLVAIGQATEAQ